VFELLSPVIGSLREFFLAFGTLGLLAWTVVKIVAITLPVILCVAFYTLWERKVIGWMHVRHGPTSIGGVMGIGVLQPFADVFKMHWRWRRRSRPGPWCRSRTAWPWPIPMPACCTCWR
jgi:hypothetical protein